MNFRLQALLLLVIILASVLASKAFAPRAETQEAARQVNNRQLTTDDSSRVEARDKNRLAETDGMPKRRWSVLDPTVGAAAATAQLIGTPFSFLNYRTYESRPIASLTKLLTAVVVLEQFGPDKKVPVGLIAVQTEGEAGELSSGEIYTARDLLKVMLMTSSNDAAAAFEEYAGGQEVFRGLMRAKILELGMAQTSVHDGSGLSDENRSTAGDLVKLAAYIAAQHPDIFAWSRLTSILVQPLNGGTTRTVSNINSLALSATFLGGKTGTSPAAGENLLAILSHGTDRIVVVLLGSKNRYDEVQGLMHWVDEAYEFPAKP